MKNTTQIYKIIALLVISVVLASCSSTNTQKSKYFGYNNDPERTVEEEKPKLKFTQPSQTEAQNQSEEEWQNPLASRSQEDIELDETISQREQVVINNYNYYQPTGYVPVIRPWHRGYYGWAAPRRGLTVTVGTGWGWNDPFYDPWYDWYNPWWDYHPYYGYRWNRPTRTVVWYNDPWVGRSQESRNNRSTTRRYAGTPTRSTSNSGYSTTRRGTSRSTTTSTNRTKYNSRTTQYGNTNRSNSSGRRGTSRSGSSRSSSPNSGSKYKPSDSKGGSNSGGSNARKGTSRSGGSKSSGNSSGGAKRSGSRRR
ncbi:MAG: hypothetical protein Kapaf2KO_19010 [Candidatus Kapaibacteriales bacterium]